MCEFIQNIKAQYFKPDTGTKQKTEIQTAETTNTDFAFWIDVQVVNHVNLIVFDDSTQQTNKTNTEHSYLFFAQKQKQKVLRVGITVTSKNVHKSNEYQRRH